MPAVPPLMSAVFISPHTFLFTYFAIIISHFWFFNNIKFITKIDKINSSNLYIYLSSQYISLDKFHFYDIMCF